MSNFSDTAGLLTQLTDEIKYLRTENERLRKWLGIIARGGPSTQGKDEFWGSGEMMRAASHCLSLED